MIPSQPSSPEKLCPQCGEPCERDMVDVGIGEIPSGPWGCPNCHWVEPDPFPELSNG